MKTIQDPRHKKRQDIIQKLFAQSFHTQPTSNPSVKEIIKHLSDIDLTIEKIAPEFPTSQINKVDLTILRLAVYELTIERENPKKVIVDEAVELAKEFGGESSPGFINGALGKLLKETIDKSKETIDDRA